MSLQGDSLNSLFRDDIWRSPWEGFNISNDRGHRRKDDKERPIEPIQKPKSI